MSRILKTRTKVRGNSWASKSPNKTQGLFDLVDRVYDRKPVESNGVYDIRIGSSDGNGRRLDESYIINYNEDGTASVIILDDAGLGKRVKEDKEVRLMSVAGVDFSIKRKWFFDCEIIYK